MILRLKGFSKIIFLLLLNSSVAFAQEALPGLNGDFIVFPEGAGFRFIDKGYSYFTEDGMTFEIETHSYDVDDYRLIHIPYASDNCFVSVGGGKVYKYIDGELRRDDKSFAFQSRFSSYNFAKGDTIVSIGGSGEFNVQNNIIYYTKVLQEWLMEYRYQPTSETNSIALGQYQPGSSKVFFNLPNEASTDNISDMVVENSFPSDIYSYNFRTRAFQNEFDLKSVFNRFFPNPESPRLRRFNNYEIPLLFDDNHILTFDFTKGEAYFHKSADTRTLLQYPKILGYNKESNRFLLVYNRDVDPHYLIINEAILLGTEYETIIIDRPGFNWLWLLVIFLPIFFLLMLRKRGVSLVKRIDEITPNLIRILSEEDFKIFRIIREHYPNGVEYPDLQSAFERELSYESRIKKLRNTVTHIDETIQALIGRKNQSVFLITKGKEDKRVKVIRLKDDEIYHFWWSKKTHKK
jgi:hypothetical protein